MLIERVDPNPTRLMLVVSSPPMVDPYILQVGLCGSKPVQIWARLAVNCINGALIYIRTLWFNPYQIWHIISNQFFAKDTYILPFISHHPQKIKKQKRDWSKHLEEGSNPLWQRIPKSQLLDHGNSCLHCKFPPEKESGLLGDFSPSTTPSRLSHLAMVWPTGARQRKFRDRNTDRNFLWVKKWLHVRANALIVQWLRHTAVRKNAELFLESDSYSLSRSSESGWIHVSLCLAQIRIEGLEWLSLVFVANYGPWVQARRKRARVCKMPNRSVEH